MPKITKKRIGVSLDMFGCPNRCRHCYLGTAPDARMTGEDLRWLAKQFRDHLRPAGIDIQVSSSVREPDFSDDYRHLYELEIELSDGEPARYELLSIWRLARDKDYAAWAKTLKPQTCQITLFGMEETTDSFYRRKGAFQDALTATERLLDQGMKPRWQIFLTKNLIPEIGDLVSMVRSMGLRERVRALGGEFQLFMHPPDPIGEGFKIEYLRPTLAAVTNLPEEILQSSREHLKTDVLWQTEGDLCRAILENGAGTPADERATGESTQFWFFVTGTWDVFCNVGTLEPWWRLGNLKADSVETVFRRFEQDDNLGLQTLLHHPEVKLVEEYGDPEGRKIYSGREQLLDLYRTRHCERLWRASNLASQ